MSEVSSDYASVLHQKESGKIRVGIYTRLTIEDARNQQKKGNLPPEESISVANQKELLQAYAQKMGWHVAKIYTDDGYKGSNFDRPGFCEMMNDVKSGVINLILVKDLSRLGRNYIEVIRYIEVILPEYNCRFVALADGIDSDLDSDNMLHIRNLFNDHYLKEVSRKIKAVHRTMAQEGKRVSGRPPYGYRVNPENRHMFIIDDFAASVVRRIYDLRRQNYGYARIAGLLNADHILSPREYEYQQKGRKYPYSMRSVWLTKSVKTILHNESYIGHRIQLKSGTISYKISKIRKKPEDEWIRVENVHAAIIDIETWNDVQAINKMMSKGKDSSPPRPRLFRGLLRCPDCGNAFTIASSTNYQCIRYQQTASVECSSHLIKESVLKQILLTDIKSYAAEIAVDKDNVIDSIIHKFSNGDCSNQNTISVELAQIRSRLAKLEQKQVQIYEDKIAGVISKEVCENFLRNSEKESEILFIREGELIRKQIKFDQTKKDIKQWVDLIEQYTDVIDIDRDLLMELVDKIEIGKRELLNGKRQQHVRIYYKFVGFLDKMYQG